MCHRRWVSGGEDGQAHVSAAAVAAEDGDDDEAMARAIAASRDDEAMARAIAASLQEPEAFAIAASREEADLNEALRLSSLEAESWMGLVAVLLVPESDAGPTRHRLDGRREVVRPLCR